jgi:hypothetical protein
VGGAGLPPFGGGGETGRFAGMRKSPWLMLLKGAAAPGAGDTDRGRFSSKDVEAANIVSPGAEGGSSNDEGILCKAPKPRVHPRAPWPPHLREGVISTGLVTSYS